MSGQVQKKMTAMKRFVLIIVISLITNSICFAQDRLLANQPYTPKEDGWFFTVPQERKIRYRLLEADYLDKQLALKDTLLKQLEEQQKLTQDLADRYQAALRASNSSHTLYFILGALTVIAGGIALGYTSHVVK